MRPGQSFESAEVARNYLHRPEYPDEVYEKLIALTPGRASALDLGCGTGKIARNISRSFESVTAIDASAPMLEIASRLQDEAAGNIAWVHGLAEAADIRGGPFDLIVAGASIHWMDHAVLFPKLRKDVRHDHVFATVDGDGAHRPPWKRAWDDFLAKWILELKGERYAPDDASSDYARFMTRYRDWIEIRGEMFAERAVSQSIDHFVRCQHSRNTFAPSVLGARQARFDDELRAILEPHAQQQTITYRVRTRVEWGSIKS